MTDKLEEKIDMLCIINYHMMDIISTHLKFSEGEISPYDRAMYNLLWLYRNQLEKVMDKQKIKDMLDWQKMKEFGDKIHG